MSELLATPKPGTLGDRLRAPVAIDIADVDTAHLLAEHRALAAVHGQLRADYNTDVNLLIGVRQDLECQVEALTELVVRADDIINEIVENQADWVKANDWLDDAAPIVGEAT